MRLSRPSTARSSQVASRLGPERTKCAQIIGVTESDTAVEITIAKASVIENSVNRRPTTPPMKKSGINAAISEALIEITVKPICLAPSIVARNGVMPCSRLRNTFSIMTMASSTTKPTATASAISEILSIEKPATHINAKVPASASGTVTPAASVAARRRRNRKTTIITSAMVASSVSCMSNTLARMVSVRSDNTEISVSGGIQRFRSGNSSLMRSTVSITLASACLVMTSRTDGCRLNHAAERLLRTPASTDAMAPSRTTVPSGLVFTTIALYWLGERSCSLLPIVRARSAPSKVPSGLAELALATARRTSSMLMPIEAIATGLTRIADRWLLGAAHGHFCNAVDLRDPLRDDAVGHVVEIARQRILRRQRQDEDRGRRRVGLAEGRQRGQIAGQIRQRCVQRGLHIARRAVDLSVEIELDGDVGRAERSSSR